MLFRILQPEETHLNYACHTHGLSSNSYTLQRRMLLLDFIPLSILTARAIKLNLCKTENATDIG